MLSEFSSGHICAWLVHFHLDGTNLQMQTHLVSKIMHQNLAIILRQLNYGKQSFIILVPGRQGSGSSQLSPVNVQIKSQFWNELIEADLLKWLRLKFWDFLNYDKIDEILLKKRKPLIWMLQTPNNFGYICFFFVYSVLCNIIHKVYYFLWVIAYITNVHSIFCCI